MNGRILKVDHCGRKTEEQDCTLGNAQKPESRAETGSGDAERAGGGRGVEN